MNDVYYLVAHRSDEEISTFATRYESFDERVIPEIFFTYMNASVVNISRSTSWGTSHVIYYVQTKEHTLPFVFRANTGRSHTPEIAMLIEQLVTDRVSPLGVPVNKVLFVDISRKAYPFDFQIQEKLLGNDVEDHFHGTKADYDQISYDLGQNVARIHSLTFDGYGLFSKNHAEKGMLQGTKTSMSDYIYVRLGDDLQFLVDHTVVSEHMYKKITQFFNNSVDLMNSCQGVLLHHDLADHNIMHRNNKITGIFDWETSCIGDPVLDLASCPTWKTHYPREEHLLKGYSSIRPLPDNFVDKRSIYLLRTMIWKMVFAIRMNIMTKDRASRFHAIVDSIFI